jgi:hypothetical protein
MAFNPKAKSYAEIATLNLVDPETGAELEDSGKPVTISIYGASSAQHRKAVDVLMAKAKKRGNREASLQERKDESIEFLAAISSSSENLEYDGPVESKEQFKAMYSDDTVSWIRDQVSDFASIQTNFFKK